MPIDILMPALSPTMTEGKLAKWLKQEGDEVAAGDVLAEIETDKATMEVEAVDEGVLGKILVPEGTDAVPVNQVIAVLLEDGEDASAISEKPQAKPAAKQPEQPASQKPEPTPQETRGPATGTTPPPPREASPDAEPEWTGATVKQTVREALRDAMAEEMRRDERVFLMGE
ncbi:MAG TPA: biotin/lipoyl-containing protein, partial [Kiloniellaceae bacterium]